MPEGTNINIIDGTLGIADKAFNKCSSLASITIPTGVTSIGINAFTGTKKGDGTTLNLNLTPGGHGAFKIHVMLDGPYANATWKGREIAVVEVPADAPRTAKVWQVPVPAVEGLKGKHAIYLVAEGADVQQPTNIRPQWGRMQQPRRPEGLFDLHGIGFSRGAEVCKPEPVPQITITADGKKLNVPAAPIRCSNANGLTDAIRYQVYGPLSNTTKLQATSDVPGVDIKVSPVVEGRATVTCTYKGQTKIFIVN